MKLKVNGKVHEIEVVTNIVAGDDKAAMAAAILMQIAVGKLADTEDMTL